MTLITNYEAFYLSAEAMSEDLRKICAAQTSGMEGFFSVRDMTIK